MPDQDNRQITADNGGNQQVDHLCAVGAVATREKRADGNRKRHVAQESSLRRNVTTEEIGNAAAFMLSDLASGITGEITYVDAGYNINALNVPEGN